MPPKRSGKIKSILTDLFSKDTKQGFRESVLEPLAEEVKALVNTLPVEAGIINSFDGMMRYDVDVAIVGQEIHITPAPNSLAEWIEEGHSSFHIAGTMLRVSPNTKTSEDGFLYMDVPVNSGMMGSGRPGGVAEGRKEFTRGMQDKVIRTMQRNTIGDQKREDAVEVMRSQIVAEARLEALALTGRRSLKSSQYQDRTLKIRRISERTLAPHQWEHPGYKPTPLLRLIEERVNRRLQLLIGEMKLRP